MNEYPHVWDSGSSTAMARFRMLTVRCEYCRRLLVPDSSSQWVLLDWYRIRGGEECPGLRAFVEDAILA